MKSLVLITKEPNDGWAKELAAILHSLGELSILQAQDFSVTQLPDGCELVIVDAAIEFVSSLIAQVHEYNPCQRVIVMTASPNWELAREALGAGAMDYLSKNLPPAEILNNIRAVLEKSVLPRAHVGAATR